MAPTFATTDALNTHLATRSYVTGFAQSADDVAAFKALKSLPAQKQHPHAYRWALHIAALTGQMISSSGAAAAPAAAADDFDDMFGDAAPAKKADDDIFNYGEGEEGDADEQAAAKARREVRNEEPPFPSISFLSLTFPSLQRMALAKKLKDEADAKAGKTKKAEKGVEKSLVVLDIKPWEADTDLEAVWKMITAQKQEGLTCCARTV